MKNLENVKEILMHKKSTTMAQDIFMNDLNDIYFELDKKERDFLEKSIDQIFRKYYYSAVEPETYITPANILSSLAEKESAGNTVFVPKVELIKKKDVLTKIKSSLHYVNSENHYMVTDFETVLEICKASLKVNIIGAPEDSERKRFEDRLFLNDRHYLNIIVLVAIKLGYIQLVKQGKKNMAITTEKSKELLGMSMKDKIKILAKGIVENYVSSSVLEIPELKDIITNNAIWEIIKNPIKFEDFMYSVNEKVGLDTDIFNKIIHDKELEYEQLEDMDANNPYSYMLAMFLIHIDVYLFTPLGYYLQLIKPFYGNVYNIAIEAGEIIAVLSGNYEHVRNMLFFVPEKFDLTLFGEEILLDGGKSERRQEIPEKYSDNSFLKCFEIREQFISEELLNLIDNYGGFDEDEDDDEDYDDNSLDEDYDDEDDDDEDYNDEDYDNDDYEDDDYDRDYEKEGFTKSEHKYNNIIDLSNYKKEDSSIEKNYRKRRDINGPEIGPEPKSKGNLYVFKVKNFHAKTIWIQVDILGESTLDDLHEVIYSNFNLDWGHLYSFFMSGKFWDNASEYHDPQADGKRKADKIRIDSLNLKEGSKFAYLYDYGDENKFEIECKRIEQPENGVKYPKISKRSKKFIEEE